MAATDARPFPTRSNRYRGYFVIRDKDGVAVTTTWTSLTCAVRTDAGAITFGTVTQIAGSHWGYFDLTGAQMNGDAVLITISLTNADSVGADICIFPHDLRCGLAGAIPTDFDQMMALLYQRFFGKVVNSGDYLKVYQEDEITPAAIMAITAGPLTKEAAY